MSCFEGLVEADQGTLPIIGPLINLQDVFHGGNKGGVGVRRDDPLLLQMRLESVFFSVRPIVLSLARSTIFSSTTASSNSCNVQRARPAGGLEQANAINLASAAPSKIRRLAEFAECLQIEAASNPSSTSRWRASGNRGDTGLERRCNLAVAPAFTTVRGIGFQQNAGLQQLLCRMFPAMDKGVELLPLRIAECHNVFLYCALFAAHVSAPSLVTRTSIQRTLTKSMTEATSQDRDGDPLLADEFLLVTDFSSGRGHVVPAV